MTGQAVDRDQDRDDPFSQPLEWLLDCAFAEENAAGFALDALSPDEQFRMANHLSWCPSCARLLHETRRTVGYLVYSAPQAAPSASVKADLFARIAAAPQQAAPDALSPARPANSALPLGMAPTDIPFIDGPRPKATAAKRRFAWEIAAAPLAAVPLVLALALIGGWAVHTQNRLNNQSARMHDVQNKNEELSATVNMLSTGLETSSTLHFDLDAADGAPKSADGKLTALSDQSWAKLSVNHLPATVGGYQVLVESRDGVMLPAGKFVPKADGSQEVQLDLSQPLNQYEAIHIQPITNTTGAAQPQADVLWADLTTNVGGDSGTDGVAAAN